MEFSKRIRGAARMQYPQDAVFAPLPHNVIRQGYRIYRAAGRAAEIKVC